MPAAPSHSVRHPAAKISAQPWLRLSTRVPGYKFLSHKYFFSSAGKVYIFHWSSQYLQRYLQIYFIKHNLYDIRTFKMKQTSLFKIHLQKAPVIPMSLVRKRLGVKCLWTHAAIYGSCLSVGKFPPVDCWLQLNNRQMLNLVFSWKSVNALLDTLERQIMWGKEYTVYFSDI